jgi:hypothetical protein
MNTLDSIRYWSKHAVDSKAMRDKAILTARAEGETLRAIAEAANLTAAGVAKIVAKATSTELTAG